MIYFDLINYIDLSYMQNYHKKRYMYLHENKIIKYAAHTLASQFNDLMHRLQ